MEAQKDQYTTIINQRKQRERYRDKEKEGESVTWLLLSTSSLVHVLSITSCFFVSVLLPAHIPAVPTTRQPN